MLMVCIESQKLRFHKNSSNDQNSKSSNGLKRFAESTIFEANLSSKAKLDKLKFIYIG